MDRSVFVWSLTSDKIREQIDLAENPIHEQNRRLIKAHPVAFADIEAKAKTLHSHYVDNVQWYGDVLLSRVRNVPLVTVCWHICENSVCRQYLLPLATDHRKYVESIVVQITSQVGREREGVHLVSQIRHLPSEPGMSDAMGDRIPRSAS